MEKKSEYRTGLKFKHQKKKKGKGGPVFNYTVKDMEINGEIVSVKVYESQAELYIKDWRARKEADRTR